MDLSRKARNIRRNIPQPHLHHLAATSSLTGAVHRFPEKVRECDTIRHDILLLELDQRLLRYQSADGAQAPEKEASTEELDAYLGFAPWREAEALERYKEMVGAGWVKPMVMWDTMVERVSPWGAIEAKDLGWPEPQTAQDLAQAAQQERETT